MSGNKSSWRCRTCGLLESKRYLKFNCSLVVAPKLLPFSFGDEPSYLGDTTSVQCTVSSGDMPIRFSWLLNGRHIKDMVGINIGSFGKKTSFLGIDALSEEHAGNFTCVAENAAGIASYSANLIVKGTFLCVS